MLTTSVSQNQHFKAYYLDNTLMLQFVVSEFLITVQLGEQLKLLTDECLQSKNKLEKGLTSLIESLTVLVGALSGPEQLAYWTKGSLTKLKDYCEQYYRNIPKQTEMIESLHQHVSEAWLGALHNLELLNALQMGVANVTHAKVKGSFATLFQSLNNMIDYIPRIISESIDNEYVMLFLLRKRELLTGIYGTLLVNKLLNLETAVRPSQKADHLSQLLQSFTDKGFEHILSMITPHIQK